MTLQLHNFFRSSSSARVRVALNLKGIPYQYLSYKLREGETRSANFLRLNPAGLVPALEREDGRVFTQSLAIIEWLDETHPSPPLLPNDADGRARVRSMAQMLACEVHPLNNLRVLQYLSTNFGADEAKQAEWFRHWVVATFDPLEIVLAKGEATGRFCHGDTPSLADICLYAQVWNNRRFNIEIGRWPVAARIYEALDGIEAFRSAAPPRQPDAVLT